SKYRPFSPKKKFPQIPPFSPQSSSSSSRSSHFYRLHSSAPKMPESRDRLVREVDFAALFARARAARIYTDEIEVALFGSLRREPAPVERPGTIFGPGFRPNLSSPRGNNIRNGRNHLSRRNPSRGIENTPTGTAGRENWNARRRNRASNSGLPSWYQRTPLHDISTITRVILNQFIDSLCFR
ncbi:Protein POLYCHOME, partial [Linum perenne]